MEEGFEDIVHDLDDLLDDPSSLGELLDETSLTGVNLSGVTPEIVGCPSGKEEKQGVRAVASKGKNKVRQSNAERCKKHRERKRMEEQKVHLENIALKRERMELMEQITELEFQAQALRGQGCMDLSVENELLKQEIKVF